MFDSELFACTLNSKRFAERKTWADVALEAGISQSTISRVCWRKQCDINTMIKLLSWLDMPFEKFIKETL